jgi:hypothetical protein
VDEDKTYQKAKPSATLNAAMRSRLRVRTRRRARRAMVCPHTASRGVRLSALMLKPLRRGGLARRSVESRNSGTDRLCRYSSHPAYPVFALVSAFASHGQLSLPVMTIVRRRVGAVIAVENQELCAILHCQSVAMTRLRAY